MSSENDRQYEEFSRASSDRLDRRFDLLSSQRRRTLLQVLNETSGDAINCSELARSIVEREGGEYTVDQDVVLIDLHHRQLPKLEDAGMVEYDHHNGAVHVLRDDKIAVLSPTKDDTASFPSQ